jgi:hypothetical protein
MPNLQRLTASLIFALSSSTAIAQAPAAQTTPASPPLVGSIAAHPGWPVAKPADVGSPEAILNAVYSVISGPKGQPRDWDRMRSLFVPDARLIPSLTTPTNPHHTDAVILTIDGYINRSSARMASAGFFERSIHNDIEQFGNIVQVWSTYESRHDPGDATPFARGINSFQILKDGDRYWVVNIFWDAESPTNTIPTQYLPTTHN